MIDEKKILEQAKTRIVKLKQELEDSKTRTRKVRQENVLLRAAVRGLRKRVKDRDKINKYLYKENKKLEEIVERYKRAES